WKSLLFNSKTFYSFQKAVPPAVTETSEKLVKEVVQPPVIVETGPYEGQYNEQSTQKTTEVITVGGEPTEGQVIVDKTVVTLDSGASPDQFAQNIAKLAEEHPELMKNANIELGEGITGKVTVTTYTTKTTTNYEPTNVIKRDPIVLAVEREKRTEMMRQRRERLYKLLPRDVEFCTRMIEAHGNDYEAMAKDPLNVHQETAKSIQRKIRIFRESPQFETYIQSKNNSPAPSPVPPPL
ncbi:Nucleolar protein 16, partial [Toxocara canis]